MPDSLPGWEDGDRQIRPSGRENGTDIIIFGSQNLARAASALSLILPPYQPDREQPRPAFAARGTQCSPGSGQGRFNFKNLPVSHPPHAARNTPTDRPNIFASRHRHPHPPAKFAPRPRRRNFNKIFFEVGPEVISSPFLPLCSLLGPCFSSGSRLV